jgi:GT2 family glycosyltransferase
LITAIVLNWNRREDSLACLASLRDQRGLSVPLRLLFVDNASEDGSVEAVAERFPEASILALPLNLGFAGGMNAGVRKALDEGAHWTLLVNNDTVAEPDLVARLHAAALADPGYLGILAPTIVRFDEPGQVWPSAGNRRRLTLAAIDTTEKPPSTEPYDVDWANGCCILVRDALWREVGGFDEAYAMYYEDHDLCLRAKSAGWRIQHVPKARIAHKVAASTGDGSPRQRFLLARSSVRYYHDHARSRGHRAFLFIYRVASFKLTLARTLLERRPGAGLAYGRGLLAGWRDLRLARADRASNQVPMKKNETMGRTSDARREAI